MVVGTSDVDGDGHTDIVGQSWSRGAQIYFGDGNGGVRGADVTSDTVAGGYNQMKVADLNSDGLDDLAITSMQAPRNLYLYLHDGIDGFLADADRAVARALPALPALAQR